METKFHTVDDNLVIETRQDVAPILEAVKRKKEILADKPVDGLGYFVGTIPEVVVEQYMREFGVTYAEMIGNDVHVQRILNNPDYSKFRVWEGRI